MLLDIHRFFILLKYLFLYIIIAVLTCCYLYIQLPLDLNCPLCPSDGLKNDIGFLLQPHSASSAFNDCIDKIVIKILFILTAILSTFSLFFLRHLVMNQVAKAGKFLLEIQLYCIDRSVTVF